MEVKNSEGRVFKMSYGDRSYCQLLLDAIRGHRIKIGETDPNDTQVFDKASIVGTSKTHRYWINVNKKKINAIRIKNGLEPFHLKSTDWYTDGFILEGLEDQPYAQVI